MEPAQQLGRDVGLLVQRAGGHRNDRAIVRRRGPGLGGIVGTSRLPCNAVVTRGLTEQVAIVDALPGLFRIDPGDRLAHGAQHVVGPLALRVALLGAEATHERDDLGLIPAHLPGEDRQSKIVVGEIG